MTWAFIMMCGVVFLLFVIAFFYGCKIDSLESKVSELTKRPVPVEPERVSYWFSCQGPDFPNASISKSCSQVEAIKAIVKYLDVEFSLIEKSIELKPIGGEKG